MAADPAGRRGSLRFIAIVLLLATIAAASGGLGMAAPPGPRGAAADSETLASLLCAAAANQRRGGEIKELARSLGETLRIEGLDAGESFLTAFPPSGAVLSMLALDRDVEDFAEAGKGMSLAAAHYRRAAMEAEVLRPLRSNYALLYAAAWKEITRSQIGREREERLLASLSQSPDLAALGEEGALSLPPKSDLEYSHPFALDIFFDEIETRGMVERGPHIRSLEAGIVVAAADDWRGGAGAVAWEKGGLSPSSGNGVIVFSPGSGRYYSYFHFFEVAVRRGDAVREGDILGRGGNTGANARKPGHGGHLHLEIYDSVRDRALSAWEIRALL